MMISHSIFSFICFDFFEVSRHFPRTKRNIYYFGCMWIFLLFILMHLWGMYVSVCLAKAKCHINRTTIVVCWICVWEKRGGDTEEQKLSSSSYRCLCCVMMPYRILSTSMSVLIKTEIEFMSYIYRIYSYSIFALYVISSYHHSDDNGSHCDHERNFVMAEHTYSYSTHMYIYTD